MYIHIFNYICSYYVEQKTLHPRKPEIPKFTWQSSPKENGLSNVKLYIKPLKEGAFAGSHYFAKYRKKGEVISLKTPLEYLLDEIEVRKCVLLLPRFA